ncbi:MAG: transposase, partial [Spirochaetales bacterium]|nr:transposase [Spirochaetales bacterium]
AERRIGTMRKPRILRDGSLYHVTARANRKEMILDSEDMKELFLEVMQRAKAKFAFRLENFCIMGNHFHFLIRPEGKTNLSRLMQWILSVFAMTYNRIHGLTGHVWGERFFSKIIAGFSEFLRVHSYVDANPVEASQVENRRDWRYGGLWHHRAGITELCAATDDLLRLMLPEHAQLQLAHVPRIKCEGNSWNSSR